MRAHRTGLWGEGVAAAHLEHAGWTILSRNFRRRRKEIDLVARRADVIAFVEVKTRSNTNHGHALEAITQRKRREIAEVAGFWVEEHGRDGMTYRFDAIAVARGRRSPVEILHVENAWGV